MGRVIEIASNHRYLHAERGFLVVDDLENEVSVGRVPLDDLAAVIAHGYQINYSNELLVRLSERGVPLVISNGNHVPVAIFFSLVGNVDQAKRFDAQVAASLPTKKRLWAQIVSAKIRQQAIVLEFFGAPSGRLWKLADKVRSGDPDNCEAQAAKIYWRSLFCGDFRRERTVPGINSALNYGYTILRAATARSIIGAGLHPTLGLHHTNESNGLRLVDDLMEPFRPFVDHQVHTLWAHRDRELDSETKKQLVNVLSHDLVTIGGVSPISSCLSTLAVSLAHVMLGERKTLVIPEPQISIDMQDQLLSND